MKAAGSTRADAVEWTHARSTSPEEEHVNEPPAKAAPTRRRRLAAARRSAPRAGGSVRTRAPLRILFVTGLISASSCTSNLVVIGNEGGAAPTGATTTGVGGAGASGAGGAGGGSVSCSGVPTVLATIGPLMPVAPQASGAALYFVTESTTQRAVERVDLGDGTVSPVGIVGAPGPVSIPRELAVNDAVYLLSSDPFELVLLPKTGGLPAAVPVPGWPATMQGLDAGGVGWVRIDKNDSFTTSPFTYGETAPGPAFTTDDVHRFDDDPIFPPVATRSATDPGFPSLFGRGSAIRYTATLPTEILVGRFDGASGVHTVAIHEPRTAATCLPGETPTSVGGPVGAVVWDAAAEPNDDRIAYWITRSQNCQVGANPPVSRTTAELVALDASTGARRLLVAPTPFPDPRKSPGPIAIDGGDVFYAPPAGPLGIVRQPFVGGPETSVLVAVAPVYLGIVGPCVVAVDGTTSPARVVTIERNAPPT